MTTGPTKSGWKQVRKLSKFQICESHHKRSEVEQPIKEQFHTTFWRICFKPVVTRGGLRHETIQSPILVYEKLPIKKFLASQKGQAIAPTSVMNTNHDDVIKWKNFPRYWPFVRGIHRSPLNSSYKGQWRGTLMFSFICTWINSWVNNREAADLRRLRALFYVIVTWRILATLIEIVLNTYLESPTAIFTWMYCAAKTLYTSPPKVLLWPITYLLF